MDILDPFPGYVGITLRMYSPIMENEVGNEVETGGYGRNYMGIIRGRFLIQMQKTIKNKCSPKPYTLNPKP